MVEQKVDCEKELKNIKTQVGMAKFLMGYYIDLPKDILKNGGGQNHLDAYFGQIKHFNWLSQESDFGSGFAPILSLLEKCKQKLGNKKLFDLLKRKTTYINLLYEELKYLEERYDWKKLPGCREIYLSKFEDFISTSCEILLMILNLYENNKMKKSKKKKFDKFEALLNEVEIQNISNYTPSINYILKMSLLIYLRNMIVHKPSKLNYSQFNKQNPYLGVVISEKAYSKKLFLVIEDFFKLHYTGKKTPNKKIKVIDGRFPYFMYEFELTKKSRVNENKIKLHYKNTIIDTAKQIYGTLFILEKDVLNKMLS